MSTQTKIDKPVMRNLKIFRLASMKRNIKIFVQNSALKHDGEDEEEEKDVFVGRDVQFNRLFMWLTSDNKRGSYLVTGYRGMGKSLLVNRVIKAITRENDERKELIFIVSVLCLMIAFFLFSLIDWTSIFRLLITTFLISLLSIISIVLVLGLHIDNKRNNIESKYSCSISNFPNRKHFDKELIYKFLGRKKDCRNKHYDRIPITINLGQEILSERDVLGILAQNVRDKYTKFVNSHQNRPLFDYTFLFLQFVISYFITFSLVVPFFGKLGDKIAYYPHHEGIWSSIVTISDSFRRVIEINSAVEICLEFVVYSMTTLLIFKITEKLLKYVPIVSVPMKIIERLNVLIDRINATVSVESGINAQPNNNFLSFSISSHRKHIVQPMANVREIENELMNIVNEITGEQNRCPSNYRVKFIFVFDELDKISNDIDKTIDTKENENNPQFDNSVKGFTDTIADEKRKQNVLRLLANMKLFLTSVNAKCLFISGHELYDASLADLSDRDFAISSIFDGVLNVSSFLSPERGQANVCSLTETYLATILLPEGYLVEKMNQNAKENVVLKEEIPSLRWFNEYLIESHILNKGNGNLDADEIEYRKEEIEYVMEFLRYFTVFLAHISNGSPKKISTYLDKYIKQYYDVETTVEWGDEITVGVPDLVDNMTKQRILYFNPTDQKLINFIYYITAPVIYAITNQVSNYGDKLLVSSSFIIDQIYKYHGRGFSWRNFEQMPELLNPTKDAELRDAMSSIIEFLLQIHITPISFGLFDFKFHKQISEEISYLSKISEDASAIFNFTLNESETVKRYNINLLNYYINASTNLDKTQYADVLERLHENLGDIYFSDEDFYRAVHEYKNALRYIMDAEQHITPQNVLQFLKCNLKMGLAYENRRTYSNAYMVYSHIINQLVHLHWTDETELGLDQTMRLTHDWRIKQPVYINDSLYNNNIKTQRQFLSNLWDENEKSLYFNKITYSLDSDKSISGFSKLYNPKKSDIFLKLTAFEEVKCIYVAILAKLFVIEKMEVSGITQSSIDMAVAEFNALHSSTNINDKFVISADFFGKMSEILYYKNNFICSASITSIYAAFMNYGIDCLSLVDEFCFSYIKQSNILESKNDAITIKDNIRNFFINTQFTISESNDLIERLKELYDQSVKNDNYADKSCVNRYLDYFGEHLLPDYEGCTKKLIACFKKRCSIYKNGYRLPCNACYYIALSMDIQTKHMFKTFKIEEDKNIINDNSRVITLLRYCSHSKLRHLKQNQVSLLASTSEQMANIMLSCSCSVESDENDFTTDIINKHTLSLLGKLTIPSSSPTINDYDMVDYYEFSQLDRAILYYWAAYRYYSIALMYKEAVHCLLRIVKVFENYLKQMQFNSDSAIFEDGDQLVGILENIFVRATRTIGNQFDNFNMAEIHEYKWMFHLDAIDNVDLSKLAVFPDLYSVFNSIVNCKIMYLKQKDIVSYRNYLLKIYKRVAPTFHHDKTFKREVESFYSKANLNKLILYNLLNEDNPIFDRNRADFDYKVPFCEQLYVFLTNTNSVSPIMNELFKQKSSCQSRLEIIEFLIHDSLVSLSYVLQILTPHNHITTFSNSFIAEVYDLLWEHSKYYELLLKINIFYENYRMGKDDENEMLLSTMESITFPDKNRLKELMLSISQIMQLNKIVFKDKLGFRSNKLVNLFRHEIDDCTIEHANTNYTAEMAIYYYKAARSINSEGIAYKNLLENMYVLDDDLRNDTIQSNLADERYLLNCGVWDKKRKWFEKLYNKSGINKLESYENVHTVRKTTNSTFENRFKDSIYTNTEY